jgi:HSP90 family molecular chaperone
MAQLQGQSGGDDITGRVGVLPMQGSVDMVAALTGRTDKNTPLAGKFGLGFVSIINSRIVKMTFMLPDQGIGWTGYVSAKALKLSYLKN